MQLNIENVIEVTGGSEMKITIITDVIKCVNAWMFLLIAFTILQNRKVMNMAINGNTHAITIFTKIG